MSRKTTFADLEPNWANRRHLDGGPADAIAFNCPEADGGCGGRHVVPVTPDKAGQERTDEPRWRRTGDELATMTLDPSIRCTGACRWHGHVRGGVVSFCEDSKSGPEWSDQ